MCAMKFQNKSSSLIIATTVMTLVVVRHSLKPKPSIDRESSSNTLLIREGVAEQHPANKRERESSSNTLLIRERQSRLPKRLYEVLWGL